MTTDTATTNSHRLRPDPGRAGRERVEFSGLRDGFPGTRRKYMLEKYGWRVLVEADARGDGIAVFEKDIARFLKSIRLKKLKR